MPTDDSRDVGAEVRAEMGRKRLSMVALSDKTGIARTTLAYQINSGRLTVETLVAVAKALDVPLSSLVGEAVA
jgi:transcriptional regulator with XRE-family HTH domain